MFRDMARYGRDPETVQRSKTKFNEPLTWERQLVAQAGGALIEPVKVFTCSWSDWFHPAADAWRDEAWAVIKATPHLTYQILTKRANRIAAHLPADWGYGYPNVWLGVTVEEQATAFRIGQIASVPAGVHFVSYEPALGWLSLGPDPVVDWVIVGGESGGQEARPFDAAWARDTIAVCRAAGVPVFVKQMGSVWARANRAKDNHGGDWDEWPADLRVREFPKVEAPVEMRQGVLL
jgi:protein gp37